MKIELKSEIAGTVWKICHAVGESVVEGDGILILESMKMEIPATTAAAGVILEIYVSEGDVVDEGQVIAIIEK